MAAPSYTYSFSNDTTADATQVNQNFTDILNGVSDGTKDLSISALTAAGTATFNGDVNLGNANTDTVTVTGRFDSDLDPATTATYALGDTSQTWLALYLDNGSTDGGSLFFNASSTAFIKSDASAGDLDIDGFTNLDINALNLKGTGDIAPETTAAEDIGTTSLAYRGLYLDNGATDGGGVFFNAGSTAFIKSDASAGDLDIDGFTNLDINALNLKGTGDIAPETTAAEDIGTTSLAYRAIYLDNGATDGGAVYFNSGTASNLTSSANGATLDVNGFTTVAIDGALTSAAHTITVSSGNNLILNKTGGSSIDFQRAGSTDYSIDVNAGSIRFLQAGSTEKMTLSSAGALTVSSQSLILTDNTSSGTTELRVLSNATSGTSKISFGHVSSADAAYMSYDVATGIIHIGTNGDTDNLTISTNQLFFDGSGGETELVLGNNSSTRGASFRYVTASGILQIATNGNDPASATSAMSVGTSQLVTFGTGIVLPTSGGSTASTLDYYEQGSLSPAFTMNASGNSSGTVTMGFTRIGNTVTLYFPAILAQSNGSDNALSAAVIPTRLLPGVEQFFLLGRGFNNGTSEAGPCMIRLHTSGTITIYRDGTAAAFWTSSASANCGLNNPVSITYRI